MMQADDMVMLIDHGDLLDFVRHHQLQDHLTPHLWRHHQRIAVDDVCDRAIEIQSFEQATPYIAVRNRALQLQPCIDHQDDLDRDLLKVTYRLLYGGMNGEDGMAPAFFS